VFPDKERFEGLGSRSTSERSSTDLSVAGLSSARGFRSTSGNRALSQNAVSPFSAQREKLNLSKISNKEA
jgi:hypothetical protein